MLNRLFDYIDRNFLKQYNIDSLGLQCQKKFMENAFKDEHEIRFREALLYYISLDRDFQTVDRELVKYAISLYIQLGRKINVKPVRNAQGIINWSGKQDLSFYTEKFECIFID